MQKTEMKINFFLFFLKIFYNTTLLLYRLIYQVKVVITQYLYLTARSVPSLIQTRSVPAFIQSIQTRSVPLFKNGDRPQFSQFQHKK